MDQQWLRLEDQLGFQIWAASRRVTGLYRSLLDPLGLTYTQYVVMLALWQSDEVMVKTLGEALLLDSGTLTPLLKKLESRDLITRRRGFEDERMVIVSLTDEGRMLEAQAAAIPEQIASLLGLSERDAADLNRILHSFLMCQACGGTDHVDAANH